MTPHIESKKEDIAKFVIMPGDPLRAEYIANKYLKNAKKVNGIRNMLAYTGEFQGKEVTVFASGMGMASMGIYAYELFQFYDVEKIIRIGSCGSKSKDVHVKDVVLAETATTYSHFAELFSGEKRQTFESSKLLNEQILNVAREKHISVHKGDIITSDVFDVYVDQEAFMKHFEEKNYLAVEMESYALFYLAHLFKREATCLLTVVDSMYEKDHIVPPEERERSLDDMIELALLTSSL